MSVGRLFGARVVLNPYFLLVLALMGFAGMLAEALVMFGVVFVHELGHVLTAGRYGLDVAEIELLPFGGVARIDDLLEYDPAVEVSVAMAGPLTNALLIGLLMFVDHYVGIGSDWSRAFLEANVVIGGFNLIPALPLDGGRVLRAILSRRVGFRRSTSIAVRIGRLCAAIMAAAGIVLLTRGLVSVSFIVVAAFVFFSAGKEEGRAAYTFMRHLVQKRTDLRRARCALCRHIAAPAESSLKDVLWEFVPQKYHLVWVLDTGGTVTGFATEADIIDAVFERGMHTPIGAISKPIA